ncbi:LOW QUALITY PROTEIN: sodium/alanine symporter [Geomicrobium sp. JCM 19037]|nr:LOW QUALITY PROTEIN: sodium/alanine symporter [Geomicrobium sp. JCM 19037]
MLWTYVLIALLIIAGLYFTIRTNFVQIRMFPEMFRVITEKRKNDTGVSAFQAFTISAAARVGTGNITGVALAITVGGLVLSFGCGPLQRSGWRPGLSRVHLASCIKKRTEIRYRGGPAYYIHKALGLRWLSILFVVLIVLCFGMIFNALQVNTITDSFQTAFDTNRLMLALILAALTALIIFGGVKRIVKVTQLIVPFMAVAYIAVALYIIVTNIEQIPGVISLIFSEAFGLSQAIGGGFGAAIMEGARRGLFSNEAGMGSVPNAAAAANVSHPAKQGLFQSLGVFFDTMIICSSTAFIILLSTGYMDVEGEGATITQFAMSQHIGEWASAFVAIAILFFAYSSVLGNYYFGETNIEFLKNGARWLPIYRVAFLIMGILGGIATVELVWTMADLFMALMAIVNITVILLLTKKAVTLLQDYTKQRKAGKDPVFYASQYPEIKNTECWGDNEDER